MVDYKEFSRQIKEKYPEYANVDDEKLAKAMIEKYPVYAEQVSFEPEYKAPGLFEKMSNDDVKKYYQNELKKRKEWEQNHPIISNLQKDFTPNYRAQQKEMELKAKYGYKAPIGEELKSGLAQAGQILVPSANVATTIATGGLLQGGTRLLPRIGAGAAQGAIQGGVLTGTHELGDNGLSLNVIPETLKGTALGATVGAALPVGFAGLQQTGRLLPMTGGFIGRTLGRLQPETINRAVNPESIALDLSPKQAQNLLTNTTERVRNAYNNLLKERGEAISSAEENLRNNTNRINVQDVLDDITGTFDQYQGENVNAARNLTGNLESNLNDLVESGTRPIDDTYSYIQQSERPNFYSKQKEAEAYDILSKATGKSVNWLKSQLNSNNFGKGTGKRKEFIDNLVTNLDDRLEILKGGDANDYAHYYNANLGYGNRDMSDVNAVERLVKQAYDDIINRNFTNESIDPLSREIAGAEQSYRYLLRDLAENSRNPQALNVAENRLNNLVKGLPEEVQEDFANKFVNDTDSIIRDRNTISPIDLQKMKQQIGQMTNWADTTRPKIQNTVLEQVYGKMRGRLEDVSPELAQANKDFAALKSFQENEGLKRILNPGDNIDSASTTLRNYDNSVTKGNVGRNVKDLESTLVKAGEEPFLNTVDDINAAMDLNNIRTTGDSLWSNIGTAAARPLLKLARAYNRSALPKAFNNIRNVFQRSAIPLSQAPRFYVGISNDDDYYLDE